MALPSNQKPVDGAVSMRTLGTIGACVVVFVLGIAVGWWGKEVPEPNKVLRESGYTYIKPVLLCNVNPPSSQNEDAGLSSALKRYIDNAQEDDVGVYYSNPSTGAWAGVNENISFSPASMLKVPIMAAVLRSGEEDERFAARTVYYDGSFDHNKLEITKPKSPLVPGRSYTIDELLHSMIVDSDNNATQLLTNLVSKDQFDTIYTDLGLAAPTINGPIDFMSPKTYSMFLRVLYGSTYLTRANSEKALSLMSQSSFANGLRAGVPAQTVVAEKFGERAATGQPSELHDCGIVYNNNENAYILCVMTRGSD